MGNTSALRWEVFFAVDGVSGKSDLTAGSRSPCGCDVPMASRRPARGERCGRV